MKELNTATTTTTTTSTDEGDDKSNSNSNGITVPTTYGRLDKSPRWETDGFEHHNNFVLFNDGRKVFVKSISRQEALTSNLVQCGRVPLSPDCRYYRMTVTDIDEGQFVMFGLTNKCLPGSPMWTIDRSVRYHSNDGGVFNGGLGIRTYHPYGKGDTVTCRLDYVGPDRSLINFLLNERFVYRQWVNLPPDQLYATIGLSRTSAQLNVEWPEPGRGDITIRNDLPSNWFGWTGITRDNEAMTFTLTEPDTSTKREAYNVQCPLAFSKSFNYFEIEVLRKGNPEHGHGIGLVSGNCEAFVYPGWMASTIGYHNDDGGLYVNGDNNEDNQSYEEFVCGAGDRMGCGVVFPRDVSRSSEREPILVLVYFTRNGQLTYTKRMRQPRGGFFPCIALFQKDDAVKLDVNAVPDTSEYPVDLHKALVTSEVSQDYRCNDAFQLQDLTQERVTLKVDVDTESAQLLQYRAEPLRNLGDCFSIEVTKFGESTEIQMGVSTEGTKLEGEFLGAENTSCGYMLKLGTIVSRDGMRAVAKWDPQKKQKIACYLDYIDDGGAVLCFTINKSLIGRGVVSRATGYNLAIYASVVISAGPAEVVADWTGILNSTKIVRTQENAEGWLKATCVEINGDNIELKPSDGYAFAASAQSAQPLVTGSAMFSVKLLAGEELPAVGLSRATHDVNNVLGSENGEICFVPSGGHILASNVKKMVDSMPEIRLGDTLMCGVAFSRPADRVSQKVVVFYALNSVIFHHCCMKTAYGGLYPTVAFSSTGGKVEVTLGKTMLAVTDEMTTLWMKERYSEDAEGDLNYTAPTFYDSRKMSVPQAIEAVLALPTENNNIKVYASHAFSDREKVDSVMKQLRSSQPCVTVETSTSRACMADKHEALSNADLVVLFVSDAYYNSHEMLTEYTTIIRQQEIPSVICAFDNKGWPPHTYFRELEKEFSSLPWVELTLKERGKPSITPLERYIDKKLEERGNENDGSKKPQNNNRTPSKSSLRPYSSRSATEADTNKTKPKSSRTCQIL